MPTRSKHGTGGTTSSTSPNIALPGIMTGKRYVAPPSLHGVREPADRLEGFADGRGVHVTIYTLGADPAQVLADMTTYRDKLEAAGRMFAPEKKIVRAGDAMTWSWGVADPVLKADPDDIPHMQHTSVRAVLRRGDDDARTTSPPAAVAVEGVHAGARTPFDHRCRPRSRPVFARGRSRGCHPSGARGRALRRRPTLCSTPPSGR